MRVEPGRGELRDDESTAPVPRGRGKQFRLLLRRQRGPVNGAEPSADALARERGSQSCLVPSAIELAHGSAPSRGIERVARVENALPAPPRVDGLRAVVATPSHGPVDVTVGAGSDGLRISIAAAPLLAERMHATQGALGRRLSAHDVRARSIRVRPTSPRGSSHDRGPGR